MPLHAWCDHVVHVHLLSQDDELGRTCAALLAEHFRDRDVDTSSDRGFVELRSSPDVPVTAADVARALVGAQVRALSVFDRPEWSVVEA